MSARASQAARRETIGSAPKPLNSGMTTAPMYDTAIIVTTDSTPGSISRPTRSPRCSPRRMSPAAKLRTRSCNSA